MAAHLHSNSLPVKTGPTAVFETSVNLFRTPRKNPKTKKQYSFHGESLKPRTNYQPTGHGVPEECYLHQQCCRTSNHTLSLLLLKNRLNQRGVWCCLVQQLFVLVPHT